MEYSKQEVDGILKLLDALILDFYKEDVTLLKCRFGMEQACAFRIGHYLCNRVSRTDYSSYDVDMEYNKNATRPKY